VQMLYIFVAIPLYGAKNGAQNYGVDRLAHASWTAVNRNDAPGLDNMTQKELTSPHKSLKSVGDLTGEEKRKPFSRPDGTPSRKALAAPWRHPG
jgi:hypothetical protein